jgi:hypothetical protein
MYDLRSRALRIAASLSKGDPTRRKLLAALKVAQPEVHVGDIFVSSWGYDQTNIDFYEVVKATAKTVMLRKLEKKVVQQSMTAEFVMPVWGRYKGRAFRRKLDGTLRGKPWVTITNYAGATLWDGKPEAQTNSLYGH